MLAFCDISNIGQIFEASASKYAMQRSFSKALDCSRAIFRLLIHLANK